jgi:CRISPR/Cas system-associated protein Csm6
MANDKPALTPEGTDLAHRVFYTLSQKHDEQARRNSKAIALLMKLLEEKGVLTNAEVDRLLVTVSRWDL